MSNAAGASVPGQKPRLKKRQLSSGTVIHVLNGHSHDFREGTDQWIDRKTPLGNPWTHLKGKTLAKYQCATRDESLARYDEWLDLQISERINREVLDELNRLYKIAKHGDLYLVCWCVPLRCHGFKIKSVIESKLHHG